MNPNRFIVRLEKGVYLTLGDGDPSRTLVMQSAHRFTEHRYAQSALEEARKYRPFKAAMILTVEGPAAEIDRLNRAGLTTKKEV